MKYLLILSLLTLAACAKQDDTPGAPNRKSVFSLWIALDGNGSVNFTGYNFGESFPVNYSFDGGLICRATLVIVGTEDNGQYQTSSAFKITGDGYTDADCANAINGSGTYGRNGANLITCRTNGSCVEWK